MTHRQRLTLLAAIMGSAVVTLDGTVVNRRVAGDRARSRLLLRVGMHASYLADVLPAMLVFGLGLSITVAPLTATVLADADESDAGIASAVNNAVARVAGLVGVSVVGVVVAGTLVGDTFAANDESVQAFHQVVFICAVLVAAGGVVGAFGIVNPRRVVEARRRPGGQLVGVPEPAVERGPAQVFPLTARGE